MAPSIIAANGIEREVRVREGNGNNILYGRLKYKPGKILKNRN